MGELLRETRQKHNYSIVEMAAATRIKPVFLEALEEGSYHLLPGPAYVTGFMRNYARALGLHPDDVVQSYYSGRQPYVPSVKPATRVLASGYQQRNRKRLYWGLASVVMLLAAAFAVKQYNDNYDHVYSAPLNVTPANLGVTQANTHHLQKQTSSRTIRLGLKAVAPVWVRVTADGSQVFQGILHHKLHTWNAHQSIYVVTYDGSHVKAIYDGHRLGKVAHRPGLTVWSATPTGWKHVS